MEKLFELLGLGSADPGEKEEQAIEKITEMKTELEGLREKPEPVAHKKVIEALGLKENASLSEALGTVEAMKQGSSQAGELSKRVSEFETRLLLKEAEELAAQAMKEGKISPSQKEWAQEYAGRDPEGFRAFVAKAPVVVPLGEAAGMSVRHAVSVDGLQLSVNRALGVDDETFTKHNGN
jgi:phage I-like protein